MKKAKKIVAEEDEEDEDEDEGDEDEDEEEDGEADAEEAKEKATIAKKVREIVKTADLTTLTMKKLREMVAEGLGRNVDHMKEYIKEVYTNI